MIDLDGYRLNIGILLTNHLNQVLLAKRYGEDAWQLPQGGIDRGESQIEALYRELNEEIGLTPDDVILLAKTKKWLRYDLPSDIRRNTRFLGQKQVWFLLKLKSLDSKIKLDNSIPAEFDNWRWVDYWHPVDVITPFKKLVYEDMLKAFAPVVFDNKHQSPKHLTRPLFCSAINLT